MRRRALLCARRGAPLLARRRLAHVLEDAALVVISDACPAPPLPPTLRDLELVKALAGPPRRDMIGGTCELFFEAGMPQQTGAAYHELRNACPQEAHLRDSQFAVTANMATWRACFMRIGVFNGGLRSGGDAEWGQRAVEQCLRQAFALHAIVRHPARAELRAKAQRTARGYRDRALGAGFGRRYFAKALLRQLLRAVKDVVAVLLLGHPPRGVSAKLKFLLAHAAMRSCHLRVAAAALLRPRDARELSRTSRG